ncbi:MAG: sulfatase-like hydrolase/transferase [Planctomycetota bacterium]
MSFRTLAKSIRPLSALLALTLLGSFGPRPADSSPSLIFVVIDDASWEEFTELPLANLQALAPAARIYDRFYTSTTCSPSRAQLQFGRDAHEFLIGSALSTNGSTGVPTTAISVAELLVAAGYRTAMFGKWHINGAQLPASVSELPRLHGYETWRAGAPGNLLQDGGHYNWFRYDDSQRTVETTYSTHAVGDAFIDWWQGTDGPKFACVSFMAPHEPFELAPADLTNGLTFAPTARGAYESAMVAIDTKLGQMAQVIDLSRTYVFLMSDNGTPPEVPPPGTQEQGFKLTQFEGGINVPLVVWGPSVAPGLDSSLTQINDVPRTALELAAAPIPGQAMTGAISFVPTLDGGAPGARPWVYSSRFKPNGGAPSLTTNEWSLVRNDGLKLVRQGSLFPGVDPFLLYDLAADPFENALVDDAATVAALLALRDEILGPGWPY